jgi:hypothetical protein
MCKSESSTAPDFGAPVEHAYSAIDATCSCTRERSRDLGDGIARGWLAFDP